MVRNTLGKIKLFGSLSLVGTLTLLSVNPTFAEGGSATLTTVVDEMLTVSLEQTNEGTLESDGLMRNKVSLIVSTNNPGGFTASMTTADATGKLAHNTRSELSLPLIETTTLRSAFATDTWGFSVDDTTEGSQSSNYKTIAKLGDATPSFITSSSNGGATKDIYFGAKASNAGSYTNSVIISVVSGVDTTIPDTPTNPTQPSDDPTPNDNTGEYIPDESYPTDTSRGVTVGRTTTSTGTTTKTVTQMTKGDTTSSYSDPQGVTNTVASINEGTPLATGLAVTAAVAATTGIIFFIAAKRRKDEDEDDDLDY